MSYIESLARELGRAGIGASRRGRILAEIQDHLSCDPNAELGDPAALARQFADELGTVRARRAGIAAFAALAVAGVLFAVAYLLGARGFPHRHADSAALGSLGAALAVIGAQVAFAAGTTALLRAFRRRGAVVLARAEAVILARRAGVGVAAGLIAMAGLALLAIEYHRGLSSSRTTLSVIALAFGAAALIAAAPAIISATRLYPRAGGDAGDLFEDLGPLVPSWLRGRPWRFALVLAAAIAVAITLAGIVQQDGYDGALRGIADALACLAGFAVLGGYLGLRSAGPA